MMAFRSPSPRSSLAPPFPPPSTAKFLSTQFLSSAFFANHPALSPINPLLRVHFRYHFQVPTSPGRPGRFRIHAASPGPQEPRTPSKQGIVTSLSRVQERVQILFAVLFWMSLFFWASAWDGRNRPDKGSRFRR